MFTRDSGYLALVRGGGSFFFRYRRNAIVPTTYPRKPWRRVHCSFSERARFGGRAPAYGAAHLTGRRTHPPRQTVTTTRPLVDKRPASFQTDTNVYFSGIRRVRLKIRAY